MSVVVLGGVGGGGGAGTVNAEGQARSMLNVRV